MGSIAQDEVTGNSVKSALVIGSDLHIVSTVAAILPAWKIEQAPDNIGALAMMKSKAYELILTDESTSGKADVELLRQMRLIHPHTRLIILTGESTPADVVASMRERAFSYFSKPISWEVFGEMVRQAAQEPCWDDGIEVVSATPAWTRVAARCDLKTAERLVQFVHEIADLPEPEKSDVASAFREMLLNAIEHGAQFDPDKYVEISYVRARHVIMCRVKDPGGGFSLDEILHCALANPPDDPVRHQMYREAQGLRPGGFGLLVAQSLVDEVIYGEKGNEVLLLKYMNSPAHIGR